MRVCARSGCNAPAAATLSYDRIALTAYLVTADDAAAREPGDLCERHVARLVLPRQWHLDDRRTTAASATDAVKPARPKRAKKLRVVPDAPAAEKPARTVSARSAAKRKWVEVGPSLFDASAEPAAAAAAAATPTAADTPVGAGDEDHPAWMPRFGPDSEMDGVLDAKTPLLRRAFGSH
jgi:hypothetical protein